MKLLNSCHYIMVMGHVVGVKYKLRENGDPFIYERRGIEKRYAEDNKIPHETALNIVLNEGGKILRIKRSEDNPTYGGCNSVPAGHVDCDEDIYERFKMIVPEKTEEAALRELKEETRRGPDCYEPIRWERFGNLTLDGPHIGYGFIIYARGDKTEFNKEIDANNSGFEEPEEVWKKLKNRPYGDFTLPSRQLLEEFLKEYPTTEETKELYHSKTKGIWI